MLVVTNAAWLAGEALERAGRALKTTSARCLDGYRELDDTARRLYSSA